MVAGQVRLASGEPVAGAHVRLFDLRDLRSWVGTTTDETGSFALPVAALPGATRSMVLINGQAGVPARALGRMPQAGAEAPEVASVYGLTVSGPGLMPFVDPAFQVGSGSVTVELVEASASMARAKTALDEHESLAGSCFSGGVLGDVDNNVDFFDAIVVALYSKDPSTILPNNGDISLGDVNADGRIDFTDAYLIARLWDFMAVF